MTTDKFPKVIELRNYLLKPNKREEFAAYFAKNFVDSQNIIGGNVLGQFFVSDLPDNFFWVRGFENMKVRSRFLPEFYYGEVWEKFGGDANKMMIDSDNVYLLKPLNSKQIFRKSETMTIDFFFAADGKLDELTGLIQKKLDQSTQAEFSLWKSELSENDFPRLPAFQDENLLVLISVFTNEAVYQSGEIPFQTMFANNHNDLERLITRKERLLIYESK